MAAAVTPAARTVLAFLVMAAGIILTTAMALVVIDYAQTH